MNPLVIVIISTYNRAQKLRSALRSVVNQTYNNLEIIVIDDGSTDNTSEVVKNFKDKRIKYLYKKNSGPYDSRNYAIRRSKGDYIAFLDDDDQYLPQKIEMQVEFMQKHKEYGFCYGNLKILKNRKSHLIISKEKENTYINLLLDGTGSYVTIQTILLKRSVVKKTGLFRLDIKRAEDYDYWLRCAKKFKFGYIDKPLAIYKLHDSNITKDHDKILKWMSFVRLIHLKKLKKSDIPKKYLKKYQWELNFHQGRVLYYKNKYKKAIPHFLSAIKTDYTKITAYIFLIQSIFGGDLIVRATYRIYMYLKFR
jgi:glycosyltransferase involved in cell wall biosynthesis